MIYCQFIVGDQQVYSAAIQRMQNTFVFKCASMMKHLLLIWKEAISKLLVFM